MALLIEKQRLSYQVRTYECDPNDNLKISSLFNFFQDAAEANIESVDIGYDYLMERNMCWIAVDYRVKFLSFPHRGDNLIIETWPSAGTPLYGIRDFRVTKDNGEEIILASSRWVLIDIVSKKPLAYSKVIPNFTTIDEHVITPDFPKISLPAQTDFSMDIPVRYDDLDANRHVNNAIYPALALDCVPKGFRDGKIPAEIAINFKNETKLGENLEAITAISGLETLHQLKIKNTDKTAALIKLIWKEN